MRVNLDELRMEGSEILTDRLPRFDMSLEEGNEQRANVLDASIALLFSDLCQLLSLDEQQHDKVLGKNGVEYVMQVLGRRESLQITSLPKAPEPVQGMVT